MTSCPLPGIAEKLKGTPVGDKLQAIINEQQKLNYKIDFNAMLGIEEDTTYKAQVEELTNAVSKYKDLITNNKDGAISVMRGVLKDDNGNDVTYKSKGGKEYKKYNPFGNPFHKWSVGEGRADGDLSAMFYNWVVNGEIPAAYDEKEVWKLDRQRDELLNGLAGLAGKKLYYDGTARGKDLSHALVLAMLADQAAKGKLNTTNKVKETDRPVFDALPENSSEPTMMYAGIGSRETPKEVLELMTKAAAWLEDKGYTLRSGAAAGADTAFESGVKSKKQIFKGFDKTGQKEVAIAHELHPDLQDAMDRTRAKKIEEKLKEGATQEEAEKAGERSAWAIQNLMARNTNQIFGAKLDTPVDFVLFYAKEDPNNPLRPKGGTGQAVEMARRKGIPTINMAEADWRKQLTAALEAKKGRTAQEVKPTEQKQIPTVDNNEDDKNTSTDSINIHSGGNNKYANLSNFRAGPVSMTGHTFFTVEHAFQYWKATVAAVDKAAAQASVIAAKTGLEAQRAGRAMKIDTKKWATETDRALEAVMRRYYTNNAQAQELLLSTGDKTLTHKDNNGKSLDSRFVKILTQIREELKNANKVKPTTQEAKPAEQPKSTADKFVVPENITELKENEVFVFGSNRAGNHGAGAALTAKEKFGAKQGEGSGLFGQTYAIPTKDTKLNTLSYDSIGVEIEEFVEHAESHPDKTFLVTAIGTGLARLKAEHILYYFQNSPDNVKLPKKWANLVPSKPAKQAQTPTAKPTVNSKVAEVAEADNTITEFKYDDSDYVLGDNKFKANHLQKVLIDKTVNMLEDNSVELHKNILIVQAKGGTGKSTAIGRAVELYGRDKSIFVAGMTITHAAKGVLQDMTNTKEVRKQGIKTSIRTVSSMLTGKSTKEIPNTLYTKGITTVADEVKLYKTLYKALKGSRKKALVVIDEVSMVNYTETAKIFDIINSINKDFGKGVVKLVVMGDYHQLPIIDAKTTSRKILTNTAPVLAPFTRLQVTDKSDDALMRVINEAETAVLLEPNRQDKNSKLYKYINNKSAEVESALGITGETETEPVTLDRYDPDSKEMPDISYLPSVVITDTYDLFTSAFKSKTLHKIKYISFKNKDVGEFNRSIREHMFGENVAKEHLIVNKDIVILYDNHIEGDNSGITNGRTFAVVGKEQLEFNAKNPAFSIADSIELEIKYKPGNYERITLKSVDTINGDYTDYSIVLPAGLFQEIANSFEHGAKDLKEVYIDRLTEHVVVKQLTSIKQADGSFKKDKVTKPLNEVAADVRAAYPTLVPFGYAYGITTYKSQGQTIDTVVYEPSVLPNKALEAANEYTAVSRAKKHLIVLRNEAENKASDDIISLSTLKKDTVKDIKNACKGS